MADRQEFDEEVLEAADGRADATAIVIIFVTLVAFAVFYASGWTFDL